MRRFAVSFALLATLLFPSTAQMAVEYDATPVVQVFEDPTIYGNGSCGVWVAWERQGQPLVDRWDVRNSMHQVGAHGPCYVELRDQAGTLLWSATVPAETNQTFVAAQVLPPGTTFNWRRATKQNLLSFSVGG